jgi:hypothetical protein
MSYLRQGASPLNYNQCRYEGSKLKFRGPRRRLEGEYAVFLGGSETYGKFIAHPFPDLVEVQTGLKCVNFGWPNAGVDAFLNDPSLLQAARGARVKVVQLPCAQNMTNRYYSVHPHRNDRFVQASDLLRELYDEVDFIDFHFTRHMLGHLAETSPERFTLIRQELQAVWIARMKTLLERITSPVILLWFSARRPEEENDSLNVSNDPVLVTRDMIEALRPMASDIAEVTASAAAVSQGTIGMVYSDLEAPAASELLGPAAHQEAAEILSPMIAEYTYQNKRPA